jgi:hypothetical protein
VENTIKEVKEEAFDGDDVIDKKCFCLPWLLQWNTVATINSIFLSLALCLTTRIGCCKIQLQLIYITEDDNQTQFGATHQLLCKLDIKLEKCYIFVYTRQ